MLNTDEKKEMSEIIEKIKVGDPINDDELKKALEFYNDLEEKLRLLGERFHFAWRNVFDTQRMLQGFAQARKERN
jgi:hypothetical protein